MGRWTWTRRRAALAACITACLIAAACGPGVSPLDPAFGAGLLTADGRDIYGITLSGTRVVVAAPDSNTGGNTRVAFWRVADAATTDQETCSTWISYSSMSRQQGAALRVRQSGGRTTAITVTNNVTWGARWGFNVHVMDSASSEPYHKIGGFILDEVFRPGGEGTTSIPPHPWRMCARAVGSVVSFIVWPLTHPQPAWGDPRYGGSVTLPAGWDLAGRAGWYIAHLDPGDRAGFEDLTTSVVSSSSPSAAESSGRSAGTTPPRAPTWIAEAP
jgi:hypothetical protein